MTRGQLNKFIEEQKLLALKKVKQDCLQAKEGRKTEIALSIDLYENLINIEDHLNSALTIIKEVIKKSGLATDPRHHWGIKSHIETAIGITSIDTVFEQDINLNLDKKYRQIDDLEAKSKASINESYTTLQMNCKIYPNTKEAILYLQSLGFSIPDADKPPVQLMKPIDTRFLIAKGEPVQEA